MSFKGEWTNFQVYNKNDIVYIPVYEYSRGIPVQSSIDYYICAISHQSGDLINPLNHEEIHWCRVNDDFIVYISSLLNPLPQIARSPSAPPTGVPRSVNLMTQEIAKNDPVVVLISEEELKLNQKKKNIKRKIVNIEKDLENYKKSKKTNNTLDLSLGERLLLLNVDLETKTFLVDKYENIKKSSSSDFSKGTTWIKTVLSLPFNKYKPFPVKVGDSKETINKFFDNVKNKLDEKIHGLDYVKDEIYEYLARKITNPKSKGHVLGLCGSAGVGKTKLISALGEALDLPFHQINMGGLNDVSVLTGHSETYVSAKPGKIVEILSNAGCMNGIIYLDEIDKFSDHKEKELNGILTHLLDEAQNDKFQDNYLSNVNIDLSKIFFVVAFNDISKIDPIVLDRMKIINIKNPSINDKLIIARDKILPGLIEGTDLNIDEELLLYIIKEKVPNENGVRQLKKCLEKVINKINYLLLIGKITDVKKEVTKRFIDDILPKDSEDNTSYNMMYV
jgi:ATP-dependent Lon protease